MSSSELADKQRWPRSTVLGIATGCPCEGDNSCRESRLRGKPDNQSERPSRTPVGPASAHGKQSVSNTSLHTNTQSSEVRSSGEPFLRFQFSNSGVGGSLRRRLF